MTTLLRLADRVFSTPLMIEPGKADAVLHAVGARLGVDAGNELLAGLPADLVAPAAAYQGAELPAGHARGGYSLAPGGVAIVPLHGTLVQRGSWLRASSGLTSYEATGRVIEAALRAPEVRAIVLDVDSGGGEVPGAFQLASLIAGRKDRKPLWAVANEKAFSAAYLIASAADRVLLPPTGAAGSIGVLYLHMDRSRAEAEAGLKVTAIYAGARKNDLSPHEPLGREARAAVQGEVDRVHRLFVAAVARHRSLGEAAVRGTEAGLFFGPDAVKAGLADAIGTLDDAVARLGGGAASVPTLVLASTTGGPVMAETTEPAVPGEDPHQQPEARKPAPAGTSPAPDTGQSDRESAAAVAALCVGKGVPQLAARLIAEGVGPEQALARIEAAAAVRGLVASAHRVNTAIEMALAEQFIAAGTSIDGVKAALHDRLVAAQSVPVVAAVSPDAGGAGSHTVIQAMHRRAIEATGGRLRIRA